MQYIFNYKVLPKPVHNQRQTHWFSTGTVLVLHLLQILTGTGIGV
jgi:hypothetical protein